MPSRTNIFSALAFLAVIVAGCSWLFWLRKIASDVNPTLLESERSAWSFWGAVPWRIHEFWDKHARLFPHSRARTYAAVSIISFFLVGLSYIVAMLLTLGRF